MICFYQRDRHFRSDGHADSLGNASKVTLKVFDVLGQEVVTLVDEKQIAGAHKIHWDGRDRMNRLVTTGVYIIKIEAGDFVSTKKMVFLK